MPAVITEGWRAMHMRAAFTVHCHARRTLPRLSFMSTKVSEPDGFFVDPGAQGESSC